MFQVLTSNLGHIVEVNGVEKGLDDYRSTPNLDFEQYRYYLLKEVFSALPDQVGTSANNWGFIWFKGFFFSYGHEKFLP